MSTHATDWDALHETIGHLTPAEKLRLIEEVARSLRAPQAVRHVRDQKAELDRLERELAELPVHNPSDGFSGRDHDELLYGGPS